MTLQELSLCQCMKPYIGTPFFNTKSRIVFANSVVVLLLCNDHGKQLWSCRDGQLINLTPLFLFRLRTPKRNS